MQFFDIAFLNNLRKPFLPKTKKMKQKGKDNAIRLEKSFARMSS